MKITMVWDPPTQKVNVNRMIIFSFIPILAIYSAWRIQKFWVLVILDFVIGFGLSMSLAPITMSFPELSVVLSIAGTIIINIIIVKHFAEKYNNKIQTD